MDSEQIAKPYCPIHRDTKMVLASGKEHYHDVKVAHWRCELWVGSGVCGQTRLIHADGEGVSPVERMAETDSSN